MKTKAFCAAMVLLVPSLSQAVEDGGKRTYKALEPGNMGLLFGIDPLTYSEGSNVQHLFRKGGVTCNQDGPSSSECRVEVTYAQSSKQLAEAMELGTSINYDAALASFDANVQSKFESCVGLNRVTAVIRAHQVFGVESYDGYVFDLDKIANMPDEDIYELCKSEVIVRQQRTAEFYVFISIENSSQSSSTDISTSIGVKIAGLGGGSVNARMFNEMRNSSRDVRVEFASHGLGNLSSAENAVRAAVADPSKSLDMIIALASDQFKQCCLPHGKPSKFYTETTRHLLLMVGRGGVLREIQQAHPQLAQILWLAKDMRQMASQLLGLCQGGEPIAVRREYFAPFIDRYQRAQVALVALARRLYADPTLPQQPLPEELNHVMSHPVRMDWCPYIDAYDSIEKSTWFKTRWGGNAIMLYDCKTACIMPFIRLKDRTYANPRHRLDPSKIDCVMFDNQNKHVGGKFE